MSYLGSCSENNKLKNNLILHKKSNRLEVSFAKYAVCSKHWMKCLLTGLSDYNIAKMFTFSSADPVYNKRLPNGETNRIVNSKFIMQHYAMFETKMIKCLKRTGALM